LRKILPFPLFHIGVELNLSPKENRTFNNKVLKRISGPKRQEGIRG
jgi:hypothetical protein